MTAMRPLRAIARAVPDARIVQHPGDIPVVTRDGTVQIAHEAGGYDVWIRRNQSRNPGEVLALVATNVSREVAIQHLVNGGP